MTSVTGPVLFGVISTAAINEHVLAGVADAHDVKFVAVASRSKDSATNYALAHQLERAYGSYEELLGDPDIDAVYISLPNSLHAEWSIRALNAGKHVLCEKPFSDNPTDVENAFDTAERSDRLLMEAFMYRHHPQTKLFAELVAAEIGELRTIRAALGGTITDATNVRMQSGLRGGALMDVGCYCVSIARLLAGEPELTVGTKIIGSSGIDIRFAGLLTFPGDVVATFDCGFDLAPTAFVEAIGSNGAVRAVDPFLLRSSTVELTSARGVTERVEVPVADSYRLEVENLAAAIRGKAEPLLGRADALGQATAIQALRISAERSGLPLRPS